MNIKKQKKIAKLIINICKIISFVIVYLPGLIILNNDEYISSSKTLLEFILTSSLVGTTLIITGILILMGIEKIIKFVSLLYSWSCSMDNCSFKEYKKNINEGN